MRKRIGKPDEKPMATPTSKTKSKATPPKVSAAEKEKDDQIHDQEPVGVTAERKPGQVEEKDVKFYRNEPSSDSIQPAEASISSSNHD